MINTRIRTHDKFSVELKIGFSVSDQKQDLNKFKINSWIFLPNGLDINRYTYTKEQFYSDLKTNVRLITPIYSLAEILEEKRGPFPRLHKAIDRLLSDAEAENGEINTEHYSYQIKMLLCILKSALREGANSIFRKNDPSAVEEACRLYCERTARITARFRSIRDEIVSDPRFNEKQKEYILFGDEFLGHITEESTYRIMQWFRRKSVYPLVKPMLAELIREGIRNSKQMNYSIPDEKEEEHNSLILIKRSLLKKLIESDLYLQRIKKTDGALAREFYYSIAAGVAMIFATIISFAATIRFGNFTSTLFFALVISYMFKDRIKEMARFYFSTKLDQKYFDWKWDVSIRNRKIGVIKEAFDFISAGKVPEEIQKLRNKGPLVEEENKVYDEKVILYRKRVQLSRKDLEEYKEYHLSGINDIIRLNLMSFTRQMDNPEIPILLPDEENGYKPIIGKRVYALYFILECESEEEKYYQKYRILFNRNGISDIYEIE